MSGVKRYDYGYKDDGFGGARYLGLIEKPDGKLVLASDYDRDTQALKAEVERLGDECEGCPMATAEELRIERDALRARVEAMRQALNHILAMQTRGFITLGDNATSMANDAMQAKP